MSNEVITLVKDTALANVIAIPEIIKQAKDMAATQALVWPLFYTAVFYLIFVGALTLLFGYAEKGFPILGIRGCGMFLEVRGLTKSFDGTAVLKGIDFTLEKGQVLSVIGSSGSGKTTLLRCINSLETADGGKIFVGGNKIFDAQDADAGRGIPREARLSFGLVFQAFHLFPQYTALENVTLAPELRIRGLCKNRSFPGSRELVC